MSFFRRAGALIARFFTSAADPAAVAGEFKLYAKPVLGVSQLFGRSDDGTVRQITPAVDIVNRGPLPNPASAPITSMAITADDSTVYCGTIADGNIWYFDAFTQLWNTIPITTGGADSRFLAISPDGTKLYVSNFSVGTVTVISLPSFTFLTTISGWTSPYDMAFTPDGTELWVLDTATAQSNVRRINVATDTLVGTPIALSTGLNPQDICFLPDGSKAYVAIGNVLAIAVIDTTTHTTVATINQATIGGQVFGVAAKPDGTEVWVCGGTNNAIYRVETTGDTIVGTPIPSTFPRGIAFTPDGVKAITTTAGPDGVTFIDVASATVTSIALGGQAPAYVLIDNTGTYAYLSSYSTPNVAVFDIGAETFLTNISTTGIVDVDLGRFDKLVFEGATVTDEGTQVLIAIAPSLPPNPIRYELPPQWRSNTTLVPTSSNIVMGTGLPNTSEFRAVRSGSIVGLSTITEPGGPGVTGGVLTAQVAINGIPGTLTITHTAVARSTGGFATQDPGTDFYNAGDLISALYTTDDDFAPNATIYLASWIQVEEI